MQSMQCSHHGDTCSHTMPVPADFPESDHCLSLSSGFFDEVVACKHEFLANQRYIK